MKTFIRQNERQSRTWPAKKAVQPPVNTILQAYMSKTSYLPAAETTLPASGLSAVPVQRVINPAACTVSQNGHYLVPQANPQILYSTAAATDPVPARLYTQGADQTNVNPPIPLRSWTPNVRLFSKQENSNIRAHKKQVPSWGIFGLLGLKKDVPDPDHSLETPLINEINQTINQNHNPTTGILGKNDCGEFATYLRHLIGASADAPNAPAPRVANQAYTGDTMYHEFHNQESDYYHYATIVGTDGVSKVTLEAHAGRDMTAPEFDIMNGITGFRAKNLAGGFVHNNERIIPLEEATPAEHLDALASSSLDEATLNERDIRTTGARKIIDTVAGIS